MKIDAKKLQAKARALVLALASEAGMDGEAKRDKAAGDLAKFIDDNTRTGIFDPFDRPFIRVFCGAIIQGAYDWAKASGELAKAQG